jgi:hypothetical protein
MNEHGGVRGPWRDGTAGEPQGAATGRAVRAHGLPTSTCSGFLCAGGGIARLSRATTCA